MGSTIERGQLGNALRLQLGLNGVKEVPNELNTDQVQATADVLQGGFGYYEIFSAQAFTGENIAGAPGATVNLVGINLSTWPGVNGAIPNQHPRTRTNAQGRREAYGPPISWETRVLGIFSQVQYDVAGATADAGKLLSYQLQLSNPKVWANASAQQTVKICSARGAQTVQAATTFYDWTWPGLGNGAAQRLGPAIPAGLWVPAEWQLSMEIFKEDLSNFPANTDLDVRVIVAQTPQFGQLPF